MQGIPIEYLAKMDSHSITMDGVEVKVNVVDFDSSSLLDTYINDMRTAVLKTRPRVVGVDVKRFTYYGKSKSGYRSYTESLVLCGGAANCLIIHLWHPIPELLKFLKDPAICFVGTSTRRPSCLSRDWGNGPVGAGALAAKVLKKPTLTGSSLRVISQEVGVHYDGPSTGAQEIKVDSMDPLVLSPEDVKLALSDAYPYYNIAHKLLSSL